MAVTCVPISGSGGLAASGWRKVTRQQSQHLKRAFLKHFAEYGNVSAAAKAAGVERNTVYAWQERDDQFVAAFREAELVATEVLEHEARRRAVEGVENTKGIYDRQGNLMAEETETKYSDTLLIFLLKARAPDKYRENRSIEVSGPNGLPIQYQDVSKLDDDELDALIADLTARDQAVARSSNARAAAAATDMDAFTGSAD